MRNGRARMKVRKEGERKDKEHSGKFKGEKQSGTLEKIQTEWDPLIGPCFTLFLSLFPFTRVPLFLYSDSFTQFVKFIEFSNFRGGIVS